ncbi:MAG: hypothetical protein IKC37_03915 [Clostridia bacterium]|nr:hypothetical protein [Clostridia bacterium]
MTDFHTHVLPRLDDGAKTVEVAAEMLRLSFEQGVKTVLATSHYYGKNRSPKEYIEARNNSYELLTPFIPDGMTIKLGAEVYLSERTPLQAEALAPLCIEGTRYLLIELPFVKDWEEVIYDKIGALVDEGCVPVIAHVDRYAAFINKPQRLLQFVEMGCLLQVNASAFLERGTKNFAFALLKKGYVHCLGTDMHDNKERKPDMAAAKSAIEGKGYTAEWSALQERMRAMISGEEWFMPALRPIKKIFGKFY